MTTQRDIDLILGAITELARSSWLHYAELGDRHRSQANCAAKALDRLREHITELEEASAMAREKFEGQR